MSEINWVKVMEDNRDTIEETIREAKKEACGCMQGWHIDVEIDENGKSWTTELFSHGSQSMSSWKGETFIVCSIKSWEIELDESDEITHDEKLYPEFLSQKDDEDGYYSASDFMRTKYPDTLEKWRKDIGDFELSEFDPSELLDIAIENEENFHRYD